MLSASLSGMFAAGAVSLAGAGATLAQPVARDGAAAQVGVPPAVRIAVVDIDRIRQASAAGRSINRQLETERQRIEAEARAAAQEVARGQDELRQQRSVLSQDEFARRREAFDARAAEIRATLAESVRHQEAAFNAAVETLETSLREVVAEIATEDGVTLVLSRRQLLLADRQLDITDRVLERLDARLPAVTVDLGARADPQPDATTP